MKLIVFVCPSPFSSVQSLSRVRLFATPGIAAHQASLSITNSRSSLKLTSIESVMPFSHLILCRPLLLLSPIPPSIRVFSNESIFHIRWPKCWSLSFSLSPSNEYSELISCGIDWFDLLAVQGTLKAVQVIPWNQFSSVAQSCPTLCDPMNRSTPGLPVHHQHPEFTQTHVHRVSDAIQPSHPLSSPSPPVPNPSQHQGLFQ